MIYIANFYILKYEKYLSLISKELKMEVKMKDYYILFGICFYIFVLGKILVTIIPGNEIANALLFLTTVLVGAMYYFQNKKDK